MKEVVVELSFPLVLDVLSTSTCVMLGLLFFTSKTKNRRANIFLGLFLLSLGLEVFESFSEAIDGITHLNFNSELLTIVFLFFYVFFTFKNKFEKWLVLLCIPWLVVVVSNLDEELVKYISYLFNISLLIFTLKQINENQYRLKDFYSDLQSRTLSWIKGIIYIFLVFHFFWIIEDIIDFSNSNITQYFALASTVLTFLIIYWIGYNGFTQSAMFFSVLFEIEEKEIVAEQEYSKEKYTEIFELIEKEKFYTISNLNLKMLSDLVNVREKELSKLINSHSKTNFYQFINGFRVNEFKKLLQSDKAKQLSILGLAQEAGFVSKSTFYSAFKNLEGITPKQYQNSLKKSE